jgi:hypothetical protein
MDATATTSAGLGLLEQLKARLSSSEFIARHRRDEKCFTRKRHLTFAAVILFLLNLLKRALQDELDEFFKVLNGEPMAVRQVTKSAFSQARQKLKYEAFVELNREQVAYFYGHFGPQTWHGFRLLAIDGSTLELPNTQDVTEHFGVWHSGNGVGCPLARASHMFDVLNHVTLDAMIASKSVGERELAAGHCAHLQPGDLLLTDRNYPAFWLFALILSQKADFCARMPIGIWNAVDEFVASGKPEQIVSLSPCPQAIRECRARGLPTDPIQVRLIRVELSTGEIEVLATSLLDSIRYPVSIFKDLYHHRWPVEEDYKAMKCRIEVENFTGTSVLAVYQDFHAKVFTMNLTAILALPAQKVVQQQSQGKKYVYQVNMANAFSKMKDTVVLLLQQANPLPLLQRLWQLMIQTIEPVRPGRSYPRKKRVKPRRFPMAYKPLR